MKKNITILFISITIVLSGCAVGPDYSRPTDLVDISGEFEYASGHIVDPNAISQNYRWWENFADPVTNDYVSRALENNYSLKAAVARITQFKASLEQVSGQKLPEINYSLTRDRGRTILNNQSVLSTTYSQGISASYVLDLFGKLESLEKAALNDYLASQSTKDAITNSLIATVINTRIQIAVIENQLDIARRTNLSRQRTLETIERRYSSGRVSSVDVRLARENIAASQSVIPELELQMTKAIHALEVLVAERPGQNKVLPHTLNELPDLGPIPVGLAASLLDRRPDVKAAELGLKAQNDRVSVSIVQLYPDFTLTGTYGFRSNDFDNVFNDDFEVYSLVMNAAAPIWRGGQLRAQVKGAKARYEELVYSYADTVLNALREVEDALVTEEKLKEKYVFLNRRFEEAIQAEELSLKRYSQGLEPLLTFLESERRRINSENELVLVKGNLWTNRVNLFLALGGNWTE